MSLRTRTLTWAGGLLLLLGLLTVSPASAAPGPDPAQTDSGVTTGTAREVTYTADHKTVLSTRTFSGATMSSTDTPDTSTSTSTGTVSPLASGSGGSPTESGCRRVTVTNVGHTILGLTAWKFLTWTDWCWRWSEHRILNQTNGWSICCADGTEYWRGLVPGTNELHYYQYTAGYPYSGYYHKRIGTWENCVLKYGCILIKYPINVLRSHGSGTWTWDATS